jgi:hypothetical protein
MTSPNPRTFPPYPWFGGVTQSLWGKFITEVHNLERKPPDCLSGNHLTGVWNDIVAVKKVLSKLGVGFHDIFVQVNGTWQCKIGGIGGYKVAALRPLFDQTPNPSGVSLIKWRKEIPSKVLGFVWKAALGRIPTADALSKRGIMVRSPNCSFCGVYREGADHILVGCHLAKDVWDWLWRWCGIPNNSVDSIVELLEFVNGWGSSSKRRVMLTAICYGALWRLWLARNERVFQNRCFSASGIMEDIISLVFMWFKHRGKLGKCNWSLWCSSPFNCL